VTLGPSVGSPGYDLRAILVDPVGTEVASVIINMNAVTTGLGGGGVRASGREEHGVFSVEIRISASQSLKLSISATSDLSESRPAEVLPGLRFLSAFRSPNELRFGAPYGPTVGSGIQLPTRAEGDSDHELILRTVEALGLIQEVTPVQVFASDFGALTGRQAAALTETGRLLRGETVTGRWETYAVRVKPDPPPVAATQTVVLEQPLSVMIGKTEVALGTRRVQLLAASLEIMDETPGEGGLLKARFVPADEDHEMTMRLIPASPLPD